MPKGYPAQCKSLRRRGLLTTDEAADYLGVSRWVAGGYLRAAVHREAGDDEFTTPDGLPRLPHAARAGRRYLVAKRQLRQFARAWSLGPFTEGA